MAAVRGRSSGLPGFLKVTGSPTRVLAVTQLMESFSSREVQQADSVDLKHLATVSAQLLRDGCDLLDVLGWRLRPA